MPAATDPQPDHPGAGGPSGAPSLTPAEKLTRNIEDALTLIERGRLARFRWQVKVHLTLRLLSVILSSSGGFGVVAERIWGGQPAPPGVAFFGAALVLAFGVGLQIANEFKIGQIAADSLHVAERCELSCAQLENILLIEDPRRPLADLLVRLMALRENEKYHAVFRELTPSQLQDVTKSARNLASGHTQRWGQLRPPPQKPKRERKPRATTLTPGAGLVPPGPTPPPANGAKTDEHKPNN